MKLKKGDVINITKDYEWKYGEPSIYNDEKMEYLVFKLNGNILDEEEEDVVIRHLKTTYEELYDKIDLTITI